MRVWEYGGMGGIEYNGAQSNVERVLLKWKWFWQVFLFS